MRSWSHFTASERRYCDILPSKQAVTCSKTTCSCICKALAVGEYRIILFSSSVSYVLTALSCSTQFLGNPQLQRVVARVCMLLRATRDLEQQEQDMTGCKIDRNEQELWKQCQVWGEACNEHDVSRSCRLLSCLLAVVGGST
jgi:hypothetical protein